METVVTIAFGATLQGGWQFDKYQTCLKSLGLQVESLDKTQMEKLGMGALIGVAQGSLAEPYLGIVRWEGGKTGDAPLAFVGKEVT